MTSKKKASKEVVDVAAYKRLEKENATLKMKLRKAELMLDQRQLLFPVSDSYFSRSSLI